MHHARVWVIASPPVMAGSFHLRCRVAFSTTRGVLYGALDTIVAASYKVRFVG